MTLAQINGFFLALMAAVFAAQRIANLTHWEHVEIAILGVLGAAGWFVLMREALKREQTRSPEEMLPSGWILLVFPLGGKAIQEGMLWIYLAGVYGAKGHSAALQCPEAWTFVAPFVLLVWVLLGLHDYFRMGESSLIRRVGTSLLKVNPTNLRPRVFRPKWERLARRMEAESSEHRIRERKKTLPADAVTGDDEATGPSSVVDEHEL
jgi:hypothetical protein